jgi:hypothetical protein
MPKIHSCFLILPTSVAHCLNFWVLIHSFICSFVHIYIHTNMYVCARVSIISGTSVKKKKKGGGPFCIYAPFPVLLPFFKCIPEIVLCEGDQHYLWCYLGHLICVKMTAFQFYIQSGKQWKFTRSRVDGDNNHVVYGQNFMIIGRVSITLFTKFAQNFMHTRCSFVWSIVKSC